MATCNFQAPNGRTSVLHAGLSQLLGDQQADVAWMKMRDRRVMERTQNWNALELDENGEPTLSATLQLLGLGTVAQAEQLSKFMQRWHLRPRMGSLTTFHGSRALAQTMAKQLQEKSGGQYNMINIRYNPTTADIEISPKKLVERVDFAPSRKELQEVPGYLEQRQELEKQREAAIAHNSKPWIQLPFITDTAVLNTKVKKMAQVEDSDEYLETEVTVGKLQAPIKRQAEILRKLLECI